MAAAAAWIIPVCATALFQTVFVKALRHIRLTSEKEAGGVCCHNRQSQSKGRCKFAGLVDKMGEFIFHLFDFLLYLMIKSYQRQDKTSIALT